MKDHEINPRQIETFHAVMTTGSMTLAADLLGVTQPAVSKLIREIEQKLQVRLFRRSNNRITPSPEAGILFDEIERFYVGMSHVSEVAGSLRQANSGSLRIASTVSLSISLLPEVTAHYLATHPNVRMHINSMDSVAVINAVSRNQCDIGFCQISYDGPGVKARRVAGLNAVCILPVSSPLAGKDLIVPEDISEQNLIVLGQMGSLRQRIDNVLFSHGIRYSRNIETTLTHSAISMVVQGLGVALIDPFAALEFSDRNVVVRPFAPDIPCDLAIVLPEHTQTSRIAQAFAENFERHVRKRIMSLIGSGPGSFKVETQS